MLKLLYLCAVLSSNRPGWAGVVEFLCLKFVGVLLRFLQSWMYKCVSVAAHCILHLFKHFSELFYQTVKPP